MGTNLNKEMLFENTSLKEPTLNILLVEDNPGDFVIVKELLKSSGINFKLTHTLTLKETLSVCIKHDYDVVLLDLGLPDTTGLETLKTIQLFKVKSPVVVMTGLDDEDTALAALREGAQDYLVKNNLNADNILRAIKYGIERKKIQDLLKKHTNRFSILSAATAAINECEDILSIYSVTCRYISMLLNKAGTIAIEFENYKTVRASDIKWLEPWFDQIKLLTGLNMRNPVFNVSDQKKEMLELFNDGKLHEIKGGIYDLFAGIIKQEVCTELERMLEINNIYAIGFMRSNNFYGGALILSQNMIADDDINIIEAISSQVSLSIHRRSIEKDLVHSEARYKKLNKELEQKVKERTRDLETVNSQLNIELAERKLTEKALVESEAKLKELNATKDKFFNIVAHDLKNPFTSLLGSTELLFENIHQLDTEKIRKLAQILNDSAKSGFAILQNLLDWSRSQTGQIKFNPEKINLKELIDEHIADLHLTASNKEIEISSDAKEDIYLFVDKNMINTVLRNLLSNAVKFTNRHGKVMVSSVISRNEITISVKDNGIGISGENIEKLFRIDTKYSRPGTYKEQGTGLGLKLSKEFVEKQGGKIWVESVENKGSEFKFSIPVKKA
jgi:two-component system sensor histidine kinase/response regulator